MIEASRISVIGAHTAQTLAYGLEKGMPWPRGALKKDMLERFKPLTEKAPDGKQNLLIAGMQTLIAMGNKPLPRRIMVGVSRSVTEIQILENGLIIAPSAEAALHYGFSIEQVHHVFFIGGKSSWEEGLKWASKAYFTLVHKEVKVHGLIHLQTGLPQMATTAGFVLTSQKEIVDDWEGEVRIDFLDYQRHTF